MASKSITRPLSLFSRQQIRSFSGSTARSRPNESGARPAASPATAPATRSSANRGLLDSLSAISRSPSRTATAQPKSPSTRSSYESLLKAFEPKPFVPPTQYTSAATTDSALDSDTVAAQTLSAGAVYKSKGQLATQSHRYFTPGSSYAPHDLSAVETSKWKVTRKRPKTDVFDQLGLDPRRCYKNPALLSMFITETGRIRGFKETGLRAVNQRRVARTIRRAVGLGIMPSVYRHPELMVYEEKQRDERR